MSEKKLQGLIYDMSSEEYHSTPGTFSSSQMKDLLEDPEVFHRKYIAKTEARLSIPAFDIGTYFHTAILEPEKLEKECAVFYGTRRGSAWDQFQLDNKGKAIITETEHEKALTLIKAVKNSPIAMGRLARGKPEISAFVDIEVSNGEIYCDGDVLGKYGWQSSKSKPGKDKIVLPMKVRADLLAEDFIQDLKSTSGNTKAEYAMRNKISEYSYDLSAAMYLDLFSIACGRVISEFVWTFASKDMGNSKSYIASCENIQIGRAKFKKAVITLAGCIRENWQFEDTMGVLNPNSWELEYIKTRPEDLL